MAKHRPHPLYCLCCGKKVPYLVNGKYCSIACRERGEEIEKGSTIFCNNCGIKFVAKMKVSRFCDKCKADKLTCECFYPESYERNLKNQNIRLQSERKMVYVGGANTDASYTSSTASAPTSPQGEGNEKIHNKQRRPRKSIKKWNESELLRFGSLEELTKLASERGFETYGKFTAYLYIKTQKG